MLPLFKDLTTRDGSVDERLFSGILEKKRTTNLSTEDEKGKKRGKKNSAC